MGNEKLENVHRILQRKWLTDVMDATKQERKDIYQAKYIY